MKIVVAVRGGFFGTVLEHGDCVSGRSGVHARVIGLSGSTTSLTRCLSPAAANVNPFGHRTRMRRPIIGFAPELLGWRPEVSAEIELKQIIDAAMAARAIY